ncbi:FecR family protein [Variovorax terrae]|uniref:FecR family protein n=1 Tax=Variovorax terrae TaxID=2923278 RepID=A0A9X1VVB3_9BURK|nr:FecR family protein [Variovorax terrae]MCJ0763903.1 FecR family protein [Variovorax terrae]
MKKTHIAVAVLALGSSYPGAWAASAGRVLAVAGDANIERAGAKVAVGVGTLVESGDTLLVGDRSALQVRFSDESIVALRANSQFRIQDYQYDRKAESDKSVLSLIKGGLRTITGLIGKANRKAFALNTPTATIGIRGTNFTVVTCDNDCTNADGSQAPNGTFGGVTDGRIDVSNQGGETEFGQQEYFFVADQNTAPTQLLAPPSVLSERGLLARGRGNTNAPPSGASGTSGTSGASGMASASGTTSAGGESGSGQTASSSPSSSSSSSSEASAPPQSSSSTQTSTSPQTSSSSQMALQGTPPVSYKAADATTTSIPTTPASNGHVVLVTDRPGGPNVREGTPDLGGFWNPAFNLTGVTNAAGLAAAIDAVATDPSYKMGFVSTSSSSAAGAYWLYDTFRVAHYIFADSPTVALPTSGIAQYNYAGGSPATDNFHRQGTFAPGNLSINYGSQSVTTLSNMVMGFGAGAGQSATSYSIAAGTQYSLAAGAQALPVTCTAGCQTGNVSTAITAGQLAGASGQSFLAVFRVQSTLLSSGAGHVAGASAAFVKAP